MQHKELDELQVAHDLYAITAPVWYHCRSQSKATISSALQPHWASMSVSVPVACTWVSISRCSSIEICGFIISILSRGRRLGNRPSSVLSCRASPDAVDRDRAVRAAPARPSERKRPHLPVLTFQPLASVTASHIAYKVLKFRRLCLPGQRKRHLKSRSFSSLALHRNRPSIVLDNFCDNI